MSFQTTEERSTALLERRVAEARVRGAMSPDEEALAIFESVALNLLLEPKTVLYFAFLAKNKLQQVVQSELTELANLQSAIQDLLNPDFSVRSKTELQNARTALIQLSDLDRVQTSSPQYKKFHSSVSSFLNKTISKAVRRPGATSLTRPGSEAKSDMGSSLSSLKALHAELNDRLFALHLGVSNFAHSPLSTIVGMRTISRVREMFDELLASIDSDGSIPANRDLVVKLITNSAAVRSMAEFPSISDELVSTDRELPKNYSVRGVSDAVPATALSSAGPFTLPASSTFALTVNGSSTGPFNFPQKAFDLNNKAAIAASAVTYPVTVPATTYLFFTLDYGGTTGNVPFKIGPLTTGARTLAQIVTELNVLFAANTALNGLMHAAEFIDTGSSRLLLYHDTKSTLRIATTHVGLQTDPVSGGTAVLYDGTIYTKSIHTLLGFSDTAVGNSGTTPIQFIVDALNYMFGSKASFQSNADSKIQVTTLSSAIGTQMAITAPSLGLSGTFNAVSDQVRLVGEVSGVQTDPVNPLTLVDPSDVFVSPQGQEVAIASVSTERITLSSPLPTFDGSIKVLSQLVLSYEALAADLSSFVSEWTNTEFVKGITSLENAMSSLSNSAQQSQRAAALDFISRLTTRLQELQSLLEGAVLPATAGQKARSVGSGILETLSERKFDRAVDLLIKCDIQEALDCDGMTASYGGAFLKSASDFAQNNLKIPNRAQDEGIETTSSQEVKGL